MKKIKKTRKMNRFVRISLALLVALSLVLPLYAAPILEEITPIPTFDQSVATAVINAYADTETDLTIQATKLLKNTQNEYAYTLAALSPYGYAIISNSNYMLLELCYTEDATPPLPMNSTVDFYYVAPTTFAVLGEDGLTLSDGTVLSTEAINSVASFENRVSSISAESLGYVAAENNLNVIQPPIITTYTENVAESYFVNLHDFGINESNTCVVIATAMLLGYYDHYIYDGYVDSQYTIQSTSSNSVGTTESFHQLLCNFVYGIDTRTAISIDYAVSGINRYFNSKSIPVAFISNTTQGMRVTQDKVISLIDDGRPCIAGYVDTSQSVTVGHCVVVYGYKYFVSESAELNSTSAELNAVNYETLMFRSHMGIKGSSDYPNYSDVLLTSSWFLQYGYVKSCTETGTHCYTVETYLSDNYHSGNYHYYKRQLVCCSCGVTSYDWVSEYCTRCVEYMSIGEELQ